MSSVHGALRYKIDREACLSAYLHQVGWAIFYEPVHDAENLPAHRHKTAYEICYIAHGTVDWWVEDTVFEVDPGCVFLTMPGEEHGGLHDIMNPCELFWVQVELPQDEALPGLTPAETASLAGKYASIEQRHFPGSSEVPVLFKRIVEEHRNPSDYGEIVIRTALVELMVGVMRSYELQRQRSATEFKHSKPIRIALQWIDQNSGHDLKIDEIAKRVGLSSTVFYKRFHEEVHVTPGEYLTQRRVHKAKTLLADSSQSITAIAHALGYSSSQYFATIFKKLTGVTPRIYRTTGLK
jgi:AraC family L-rhamnose operon regulatory protein RhaS